MVIMSVVVFNSMMNCAYSDEKKKEREWRFPVGIFAGTSGIGVKAGFEYNYIGIYGTASTFGLKHFGYKDGINVMGAIGNAIGDELPDGLFLNKLGLNINMADYGIDLRLKPFNGAFHIDIGYHYMDYRVPLSASMITIVDDLISTDTPLDIRPTAISADITMRIAKGWKPYFGLGWDLRLVKQLYLTFDIGVMYTGKWKPVINVNYDGLKDGIKEALEQQAGATGENTTDTYANIKDRLEGQFGFSGDELDSYVKQAIENGTISVGGLIDDSGNINESATVDISEIATGSIAGITNQIDEKVQELRDGVNDSYNNIKISNYSKVWPVIKLGFVYKF